MTDIDLTGDIALAIDGAAEHHSALVLGYVADDGTPALSFRGSTQVHSPDQLGIWVRKRDDGLIPAIEQRPHVSLIYHSPETPGSIYLSIKGRAKVAPELDDLVYSRMIQGERDQDPERKGVAVLIDVDSVLAAGSAGVVQQVRSDPVKA